MKDTICSYSSPVALTEEPILFFFGGGMRCTGQSKNPMAELSFPEM